MLKRLALPWTTVYADDETGYFLPLTPFMPATEIAQYRVTFELISETSADIQVQAATQQANVENAPDSATTFGSNLTSESVQYPSGWTTAAYTKQLARFGFLVKLGQAGSLALGRVGGVLEIKTCS